MLDICARNCFVAEVLPPFSARLFSLFLAGIAFVCHGMAAAKGAGRPEANTC
jgi:hypothetical protein